MRNHGSADSDTPIAGTIPRQRCAIDGCEYQARAGGLCSTHYWRQNKYGDAMADVPIAKRPVYDSSCRAPDCPLPASTRGWCKGHYARWFRTGDAREDLPIGVRPGPKPCSVEGCEKPYSRPPKPAVPDRSPKPRVNSGTCSIAECERDAHCRGWCNKHYTRWLKHGDPEVLLISRHDGTVEDRFWAKVDQSGECWNWTAGKNSLGYGTFSADGVSWLSHRFAYDLVIGPIPDGLELDHICHNRACVRPDHLRPVTRKQNIENHHGPRADSASGIRGVSWDKTYNQWRAGVQHNGKYVYSELFDDIRDAESAVKVKRIEFHSHNDRDRFA